MSRQRRRVVVTGMGIVSPVGSTIDSAWANLLAGRSGATPITRWDASTYPTRFAAQVQGFDPAQWMTPKDLKKTDTFIHYGMAASKQAVADAGLEVTDANRARIAVCVGSGIGGLTTIEEEVHTLQEQGVRRVSPFYIPAMIINMISGHVSIEFGITGPNLAVVSACTTGTHAIGLGLRMLQWGDADACIVGGAEFGSTPSAIAGFCQARALSRRNDAPEKASRPWDRDRDGFVLGDGAGVMVLEEYEHARRRGARIHAEIIGFGMSADASHITLPPEDGHGARQCMQATLADAELRPDQVDYINAHGTSTPAGDLAETRAVKAAFGDHAYELTVSSTKSVTGHLLGAAGGVEAIFSVLALRDQVVPPTINLDNPDEGCDLDYAAHQPKPRRIEVAISNSFGFGGTNGTVAFRRFS